MRKFLFFLLCTVTFYLLASCEKEEHLDGKGDKPLVDTPKDTIQEEFLLKWDTFMGHRTKRILRIERKEYQTY